MEINPRSITLYAPLLRPASFATLPRGLQWEYVEAPWDIAHVRRDLPRSANRHGLIATSRPLTQDECDNFGLEARPLQKQSCTSAFVITHPEWGIYLGCCMGLGFWSKMDPVGQPSAVTFSSIELAERHMASWDSGRPADASTAPVVPDDGQYATVAACVAAGLEGWLDTLTPSANELVL